MATEKWYTSDHLQKSIENTGGVQYLHAVATNPLKKTFIKWTQDAQKRKVQLWNWSEIGITYDRPSKIMIPARKEEFKNVVIVGFSQSA